MRFLHTSDWHLGKSLHEVSLIKDQECFLDQIKEELLSGKKQGNPYSGLFISGDLYDRPIPPSDAVILLNNFITEIHELFPELHIFLVSGNHDSAERLSFLKDLVSLMNVHIATDVSSFCSPVCIKDPETDKNYAVYQLPFLYPGAFYDEDGKPLTKQNDLYSYACKKILESHKKNNPQAKSILVAHLLTMSSLVSDSERSFVGTAEEVDASVFECFDYTALGHLHSFQKAGKTGKVIYSGSPLSYSFDDNPQKYMLSVEFSDKLNISKIPFKPLHPVVRLKGAFSEFYGESENKELIKKYKNSYVEIINTDSVKPEGAVNLLRTNFPLLLSYRQELETDVSVNAQIKEREEALASNNPEEIFDHFIKETYGQDCVIQQEEKREFINICKDLGWSK